MKCLILRAGIMTLISCIIVNAAETKIKDELQNLTQQIEILKTLHLTDVGRLKKEVEELKESCGSHSTTNHERNEQATLQWAKASMKEIRTEMRELSESVNNSALLRDLHVIRNELKKALVETTDLAQLSRTQEARVDKLDNEVGRLKYDHQQMHSMIVELRNHFNKLSREMNTKQLEEENFNEVVENHDNPRQMHKIRHNKMLHSQMSRLARALDQLEEYHQTLQTQLLDVQRRTDRLEEPNWNLLSAKTDLLEFENKIIREEVKNTTQKLSDFDKLHASLLELREDVESIENKADKIIPEIRKEISKLDINYAQLNAQSSYLKEDQENLRQSVKAIAVSVSNTIDRAEMDRLLLTKINDSISDLQTRSKQHFYRLNDHILKSEANNANNTETITLPELIGEVKELQPVEKEYEVLINQLPKDCSFISGPDSTYLIHPGHVPVETHCVNGTTLLQRRFNGSVEFNRKFNEYVHGFGEATSEFWIGLETMHLITADNCSGMRIDMTDIYGGNWYAQYEHFSVGGEETGYVLNVGGFEGNASDAFEYQNHMEFSTIDRDRDISNTHCAGNYEGGWWFSHCQHVNINGKYTLGLTWFDSAKNEWIAVASSEMRTFRRPGCP